MAIERIVSALAVDEVEVEQELDQTLRPKDFDNYIGQKRLEQNLKLAIDAAKRAFQLVRAWLALPPLPTSFASS